MKIFRVVTERDGITTKQSGNVDIEIIQSDYRYASDTIEQVWSEIKKFLIGRDEIIVAVVEEYPSIIVLPQQSLSEDL